MTLSLFLFILAFLLFSFSLFFFHPLLFCFSLHLLFLLFFSYIFSSLINYFPLIFLALFLISSFILIPKELIKGKTNRCKKTLSNCVNGCLILFRQFSIPSSTISYRTTDTWNFNMGIALENKALNILDIVIIIIKIFPYIYQYYIFEMLETKSIKPEIQYLKYLL